MWRLRGPDGRRRPERITEDTCMKNYEELMAAVDRAMAALEEIKRCLEAERPAPEPEAQPEIAAVETPEGELPLYSAARNMRGAARLAAERCREWEYRDEAGLPVDKSLLLYSCEEEDRKNGLDPLDARSYYIVSPEGAIGRTLDDGETVDWIFLPAGKRTADMPASLGPGTPMAPKPAPAAPTPAEAPGDSVPELVLESAPELQHVLETAPELVLTPPPAEEPVSAPAAPVAAAGSVCPACGKPVRTGSKFCRSCGAALPAAPAEPAAPVPETRFCQGCGAPLRKGDLFCMKCGHRVES